MPNPIENMLRYKPDSFQDYGFSSGYIIAGEFKAKHVGDGLRHKLNFEFTRVDSEWNEDGHGKPISPSGSAQMKLVGLLHTLAHDQIALATDVQGVDECGSIIGKPVLSGSNNLVDYLDEQLSIPRELTVRVGIAAGVNRSDFPLAIAATEQHRFKTLPFTRAELASLVETHGSENLCRANMGCFWPADGFASHIVAVDGVSKEDPMFGEKLAALFSSLRGGSPVTIKKLVDELSSCDLEIGMPVEGGRFRWMRIIYSRDGTPYYVAPFSSQVAKDVSDMAWQNFNRADNYRDLDVELRDAYISANTPDGVLETSTHPDNLVSFVVYDMEGGVVGWRVIRGERDESGNLVGNGRRLHIAMSKQSSGLGRGVMQVSEDLALDAGAHAVYVNSSGGSSPFFQYMGYDVVRRVEDTQGVFNTTDGKPVKVVLRKRLII